MTPLEILAAVSLALSAGWGLARIHYLRQTKLLAGRVRHWQDAHADLVRENAQLRERAAGYEVINDG